MRQFLASLVVVLLPISASATLLTFDFTTLGGGVNNTLLGTSATDAGSGVIADAINFTDPATTTPRLWLRNQTNDHGLGVCTEGASCATGGGDVNELDNSGKVEGIRLTRPVATTWNQLWVSSLDSGGSNNNESGILLWSNSDPTFGTNDGSFQFSYSALGGGKVEGNILALLGAPVFNSSSARYLLFKNDTSNGTNNDYLIWKGVIETTTSRLTVPEPGSIALLGLGLAGLATSLRRKLN